MTMQAPGQKRGDDACAPSPLLAISSCYRRSERSELGDWLACANTEVPACSRICDLVNITVAAATLVSRIAEREDSMFSCEIASLFMELVNRFMTAPIVARVCDTWLIALSSVL